MTRLLLLLLGSAISVGAAGSATVEGAELVATISSNLSDVTDSTLEVIDIHTGKRTRTGTVGGSPAFSADGRRRAFLRDDDVYLGNADGTDMTRFRIDGARYAALTIAPDGSRVAFPCRGPLPRSDEICVWNGKSRPTRTKLKLPPRIIQTLSWSPAGDTIVFSWYRIDLGYVEPEDPRDDGQIATHSLRSHRTSVVADYRVRAGGPIWTQDGTEILYSGIVWPKVGDQPRRFIRRMRADGSRKRLVVELPSSVGFASELALSPDGSTLAFVGLRAEKYRLWTFRFGSAQPRQVPGSARYIGGLAWRRTG